MRQLICHLRSHGYVHSRPCVTDRIRAGAGQTTARDDDTTDEGTR